MEKQKLTNGATKLTRGEKIRREIFDKLEKFIGEDFGRKCQDHPEECIICSVYKALNELQRAYGYKETN